MKRRLVLATDSLEPSGVGEHMLTLGAALADQYAIILAAPDNQSGRSLLREAAILGLGIKTLDLADPRAIGSWLAGLGATLLHVHAGIGWEGHDLVRLGKGAGITVVRTEHLPYLLTDPVQQAAYRAMLLSVDGRIAVSNAVFDSFRDHGGTPLVTVRNGVVPKHSSASRQAVRRALGLTESQKLLLTVARFSPQKAHRVLVEAAPALLERFPDGKFVLVGNGPEEDDIRERIERSALADSFILLGRRDDVPDLMSAADLFLLPSLFEGMPLALLEAMALGLPAVATTAGGSVEALGREHPFLASSGDAAAFAAAIIRALGNTEEAKASARVAQERFTTRFSAVRMAAETAGFYQSVLQRRDGRGSSS